MHVAAFTSWNSVVCSGMEPDGDARHPKRPKNGTSQAAEINNLARYPIKKR